MKFASVNGEKVEAKPKERGICEECAGEMISHCGAKRIWHWKHYRKPPYCWHENETPWHRAWKEYFPTEWQEEIHKDLNGEKHKADIKTAKGHVIEFQCSHIDPEEREKREEFYKDMAWVVNGTRLRKDYPKFHKSFPALREIKGSLYFADFPEEHFPGDWLKSTKPVYFDFQRNESNELIDSQDEKRSFLWGLLPEHIGRKAIVFKISHENFINFSKTRSHLDFAQKVSESILQKICSVRESKSFFIRSTIEQYRKKYNKPENF